MSAFVFGSALDALTGIGCAIVLAVAALFPSTRPQQEHCQNP
jgi:hypothetical protein